MLVKAAPHHHSPEGQWWILCNIPIKCINRRFVVLCFVVFTSAVMIGSVWFIYSSGSGLLHWHWGTGLPRAIAVTRKDINQCQTTGKLETWDHSGYGLGQWEEALHWYGLSQWEEALLCNAFSHWPSPYPEWSLWNVCIIMYCNVLCMCCST